jgi:hypothetical protein
MKAPTLGFHLPIELPHFRVIVFLFHTYSKLLLRLLYFFLHLAHLLLAQHLDKIQLPGVLYNKMGDFPIDL